MTDDSSRPAQRRANLVASASLIGLIALCLAWELFLAPLRPGGSWLVLKTLPLLLPLRGILNGRRYTFQWASMFILIYFTEGMVRATSDKGAQAALAAGEAMLATIFFVAAIIFCRITGRRKA
ncbi:MAG: DUF2069 domain-containing protein [Rhodocyclaceae bacterium]|nr:DUF2069 domain-containing protein [Rhodocyclaceae bacterium]